LIEPHLLLYAPADGAPPPFEQAVTATPIRATHLDQLRSLLDDPRVAMVCLPVATARQLLEAHRDGRHSSAHMDMLYRAGLDLAALDPKTLANLSSEQRIEQIKKNIVGYARDLLKQEHVDIRLVNAATGLLEPLVCEGMNPGARDLKLYAREHGNGTSGRVAFTGKSYLCRDTSRDPLFIAGAPGTRSSLTVPVIDRDRVIGVLSVESPELDAFSPEDQESLELFGREIGAALHALEMLTAERRGVANQSVELISREVAIPVDAILNAATSLLDRYIGLDPDIVEHLQQINASARSIRRCIQKVGESLLPTGSPVEPPPSPLTPRFQDLTVLVVDNDERVRRSAHATLGKLGCIVETAHNGKEALAMAKQNRYQFVLCDIGLPDMNGYEIFHRLRQIDPNQAVVLMSGYGYDPSHSIVRARQEGMKGVLFKPFRIDQLIDVLEPAPPPSQNGSAK
jgi:CheY-like chemotaxis protein